MSNNLREYRSMDFGDTGESSMSVTAFIGGEYGSGIQFTICGKYCALAGNQVKDLITALQKRLRRTKKYQATSNDLDITVTPRRAR